MTTFASAIGAMQLLPDNAAILWRLGVAACLIGEQPYRPEAELPDGGDLALLLEEGEVASAAAMMEDPREDLFTEQLLTHAGPCLVGAGFDTDAVYVMRLFLLAYVQNPDIPATLRRELRDMETAVSLLSNAVFTSAGLTRNVRPGGDRQVHFPTDEGMLRLQQAVTFEPRRLEEQLGPLVSSLEPFVLNAGSERFTDDEIMQGPAWRFSVLRVGDFLIVHQPHGLMANLRHRFALRVVEELGEETAAEAFAEVVAQDVHRSLRSMGWNPDEPVTRQPFVEIRSEIDKDKVGIALIAVDDFKGLVDVDPFGTWGTPSTATMFDDYFDEVATRVAAAGDIPFGLFVLQPAGRAAFSPLAGKEPPSVGVSAADLEVIAFDEPGDPLNLWKFARAMGQVQAERLLLWSSLDGYGIYRSQGNSLEVWSGATMVTVEPGSGAELRLDMKVTRDRRGALFTHGGFVEVEHASRDEAELGRIYRLSMPAGPGQHALHVDGGSISFWVLGPPKHADLAYHVVETVAYWLAELVPEVETQLEVLRAKTPAIRIEVEIDDAEAWRTEDGGGESLGSVKSDEHAVRLSLGGGLAAKASQTDNSADRCIVSFLIDALEDLTTDLLFPDREAIVDRVAPLGVKKHLIMFPIADHPMIVVTDRSARGIKRDDESAVRYALGAYLQDKFDLSAGPVASELRDDVLKSGVAFLFQEMTARVAEAEGDGLLEQVMQEAERALAVSQRQLTMLPMREATYPLARESLREDIAEANRTNICLRFLVEYVAAQPPRGDASWSLERLDQILPYVAEILDWGALDDAVHFELSRVDLLINDDGQLRLAELDRYHEGRQGLFNAHVEDQRTESTQRWLDESDAREQADWSERIAFLMKEESGATLDEIGTTLIAANQEAAARNIDVVRLELDEAIDAIAARWEKPDRGAIRAAIDYLSMNPREDFLRPPTGGRLDTYPWLNARRWSYNRRPFLRDDSGQVLWGRRQVLASLQVLYGQLSSGKYQALAETDALREELGRLAKERGTAFEDHVYGLVNAASDFLVRQRVTAIGGVRLERQQGQTLGDIDVLAVDRSTRRIWALECKDLSGTQTTAEIAREMSEHFGDRSTSSSGKHAKRVDWLVQHIDKALLEFAIPDDPAGWVADGLIVTGRRVAAPYIADGRFEVAVADEAVERLRELGRQRSSA